jgi:hypothetical protein
VSTGMHCKVWLLTPCKSSLFFSPWLGEHLQSISKSYSSSASARQEKCNFWKCFASAHSINHRPSIIDAPGEQGRHSTGALQAHCALFWSSFTNAEQKPEPSFENATGEHRYALQSVVAYALQKQLFFSTMIGWTLAKYFQKLQFFCFRTAGKV